MYILLIEDNPGDILLISEHLKELDKEYDLAVITNASNVINQLEGIDNHPEIHKPDLIILDSSLPRMSGLEILARIKEIKRLQDTYVVILAGTLDPEMKETSLKMGADAYFSKPEDLAEYEETISQILGMANNKSK